MPAFENVRMMGYLWMPDFSDFKDKKKDKEREAIRKLEIEQKNNDTELAHINADKILLEFVPDSVARAWKKIEKWYS
jgi:hypothetical protein